MACSGGTFVVTAVSDCRLSGVCQYIVANLRAIGDLADGTAIRAPKTSPPSSCRRGRNGDLFRTCDCDTPNWRRHRSIAHPLSFAAR